GILRGNLGWRRCGHPRTPRGEEAERLFAPSLLGSRIAGKQVMVRLACWAMNTRFEVALCGGDEAHLTAAGEEALGGIQLLDQQLSFFRSDSEIRALNVYAATAPMPAEPRLFALLKRAITISEAMEGAFDPTTAPLLRCWGLAGEGGRVP